MRFKDSGIEWLGEIPEHWEVKKIKYIYKSINGFTPDTSNASYYDNFNGYDWITISDINKKYVNKSEVKVSQKYIDKFRPQITPKGSLLYSFKLSVGLVAFAEKDIYTNEAILSFLKTNDVDLNFLYYSSFLIQFNAKENIYGAKLLNKELINNAFIVLPPLQEQKAIADYLDKKCDKISQFIESKQKLITLLQEKKQTLINAVVCRGLNKNTELKESGVEYLGIIPKHWGVRKLKTLFSLGNGLNITKENFASCGIPCVNYGEIHSKYPCRLDIAIHKLPFVSKEYLRIKPQSLLQKGDFVFADTSEDIEGSGNFTSIQSSESIFAGYHTIILKPKSEINSLYFSFLFDSLNIRHQIRKEVCGVKVYSITKAILKEVQLIIPPLQEQKAIASYLDTQITKIDLAIEKTKQQITYIKEYKTSLINQAICGRIALKD